jgi:hypothetical protein
MTLQEFRDSVAQEAPPRGVSLALQAMWYDAKNDWDQAHRLAQAQDDQTGAWVHAYLHRVEGDAANAAGWYRRAGRPVSQQSLPDEWQTIVSELLRN